MSEEVSAARGRAGGFADWVGAAADLRHRVAEAFLETFRSWGYAPIATPLLEPLATVGTGLRDVEQSQLFRFMDSDGTLLALVGERTVSVARVVATQMSRGPFPLRLCYAGPVLRNQPLLGGRRREALQAGCELVGGHGLAGDAECIALAASALERAGIGGVQIDVGHANLLPALLESAGLGPEAAIAVRAALQRRDLVAVEEVLGHSEIAEAERELLLGFPTLRGGHEILDVARSRLPGATSAHAVLDELAELWSLLDSHGITDRVHLDLGAVRDWDYYTGPIFELFTADLGFPLGSGGRYDRLLSGFGEDLPATGFVLHVDRCCDAELRHGEVTTVQPLAVTFDSGCGTAAHLLARRLRDAGAAVACALDAGAPDGGVHVHADGRVSWPDGEGDADDALRALTAERGGEHVP